VNSTNSARAIFDKDRESCELSWVNPKAVLPHLASLSGVEQLRSGANHELPPAPIAEALGGELLEAGEGRLIWAVEPAGWMQNAFGTVAGGIAATILDGCMGAALLTTLGPGTGLASSDLHVRFVRPISVTGRVIAEGNVIHRSRSAAVVDGKLTDETTGKLLATASSSCVILHNDR
jgi:uncharacterized protein (TIGR00369 family)